MPPSSPARRLASACLLGLAAAAPAADLATLPAATAIPADLAAFQKTVSPAILAHRAVAAKHWRQIEPAVHQLALEHVDRLAALADDDRAAMLAALAGFIDERRAAAGPTPVLAPGRTVIGLLDPTQGLAPQEITAIATAYGCDPVTVFKRSAPDDTLESIAAGFLAAVQAALAAGKPTTVIVLGHGLPTEIQSYHIPFERLAACLLDGATAAAAADGPLDLGGLTIICDDCFSADFLVNLCTALEMGCHDRGRRLAALPACIAGTNHGRVGHAATGEKFVPYFWRDVIELYFVRRPHPPAVTLRHFFENVDNLMYGHGRAPIVVGTEVRDWRVVDPDQVQDPVVIVPLDDDDLVALRRILGLPADASLPRWLDVG